MNEFTIQIIMLVLLFVAMYFILIRPQKKREKEVAAMRESLKVGDDIVTIGGIYGKVVRVKEEKYTIQVGADKTRLEVAKWAISQKMLTDSKSKISSPKEESLSEPEEAISKPTPKTIKKLGAKESDSTTEK